SVPREGRRDVTASYRGGERMAVAHGLAHGHDIGHYFVQRETPEALACPAEPRLHFVRDEQPTCVAHVTGGPRQVTRRYRNDAFGGNDGIQHQRREPYATTP